MVNVFVIPMVNGLMISLVLCILTIYWIFFGGFEGENRDLTKAEFKSLKKAGL